MMMVLKKMSFFYQKLQIKARFQILWSIRNIFKYITLLKKKDVNTTELEKEFDEYRYAISDDSSQDLDADNQSPNKYGNQSVDLSQYRD